MSRKTKPGKRSRDNRAQRKLKEQRALSRRRLLIRAGIVSAVAASGVPIYLLSRAPEPQQSTIVTTKQYLEELEPIAAKGDPRTLYLLLFTHSGKVLGEQNHMHVQDTLECNFLLYRQLEQLYRNEGLQGLFDEGAEEGGTTVGNFSLDDRLLLSQQARNNEENKRFG